MLDLDDGFSEKARPTKAGISFAYELDRLVDSINYNYLHLVKEPWASRVD